MTEPNYLFLKYIHGGISKITVLTLGVPGSPLKFSQSEA